MTVSRADVKWIQVEATTKCNAWCPACARNTDGYGLAPTLKIQDLSVARLDEVLSLFPNLEVVHFCGTYGDAIASNDINNMIDVAKQHCKKIQLNTNGSLRNEDWWHNFAVQLADIDHDIWFCLDGLEDTHHIYRQGTNFQTIIDNAQAFINAGGQASWQFIPWAHNEHQITDCIKMSQQLGFKNFRFIKNARSNFSAKHYRTGEPVHIVNWSKNKTYNKFIKKLERVDPDNCLHLTQPSVYLNANGTLSACCWINLQDTFDTIDQLPNIATELATDPRPICINSCGSPNV
jgi:hypothetical protein